MLRPRPPLAFGLVSFAPLFALTLAGCGGGGGSGDTANTTSGPDPCEPMVEECFGKQQVCVANGEEAACEACPAGKYATAAGTCDPIPGKPISHDFDEFTVQSGEESLGLCQSWTVHNAEEIWVNGVELTQDEASHHSNWMFVPDTSFEGPDGVWPCQDRGYSQLSAALVGGVLYAQSTQAAHEVQRFPNNAAVRIPPFARIIGDVHLLNTTDEPITGHANLTIYGLEEADVKVKLAPFHFTYEGLHIPPHATSRFTGRCDLDAKFQSISAVPFNMKIYYLLPHYHAMGAAFFMEFKGGDKDGERLFEIGSFDSEAHGKAFDPPVSVEGSTGLSFGCEYVNTRDEYVDWGFGDQEMCEVLGFAESTVAFESSIDTAEPEGQDGMTQLFTGQCNTLAFEWDNNKPGGKGP